MENKLILKGVNTHNLKGFDLEVPKNKLVVFTGVSGCGKSSLVFDTIYTEAQRQLIETFSSFARIIKIKWVYCCLLRCRNP